jgi:bifunctional UDP-N-acetylglucosamine pyrophosphorylase / glucosamine-1-phosphate N-acetyltransferase
MSFSIIILAAGLGKRMHSTLPKVLHPLAGRPLLAHVLDTARQLQPHSLYVVHGYGGEQIQAAFQSLPITWIHQAELLGTGHAVLQTLPHLSEDEQVLILFGDVPLISFDTLKDLIQNTPSQDIGWLTAMVEDSTGFGRILRNAQGQAIQIIEDKDATEDQKKIKEINTGICLIPSLYLKQWLPLLKSQNAQKEYYLTDIFAIAIQQRKVIHTFQPQSNDEILGVNDQLQLSQLERIYQHEKATQYLRAGLHIVDPNRFDVRGELQFGQDNTIDLNVIIEGQVILGNHCFIGPNVYLKNVTLGDHVKILANSFIEGAVIGNLCSVGPFARIRPDTELKEKVTIGNFAEIKKSTIDERTKIHHVSYIGDSLIGKDVNIGAGTITCNYNGATKSQTIIGDGAFIGSDSVLVAPLEIGAYAYIGAGSTITKEAPPHKLTVGRAKQVTIDHWKRPKKPIDSTTKGEA